MLRRDLNLRHMRGLLEVRARGSISAAAGALGTSQPALTQGIAKLEQQLQHKLFERRARGLVITPAGETAALRVRAALDHLAQGMRAVAGKAIDPERRLSLAQVQALLALVEAGSFGAAGAATGMAAASIHRAVRAMEEAVGRPLVERRGRAVAVNAQGRRLARSGRLALAEIDALCSDLGLLQSAPTIVVGTTPLARAFLVPEAMATMNAQGGGAGFRVLEGSWGELAEALREGLVDILIGEAPPQVHPELEVRVLHDAPLVIAAGRLHPLVGRRAGVAKLASFPWIVAPRGTALRDAWERLFAGRVVQAPVECGSIMIIGRLLTSSEQLTLATPDQVALQIRSGLLARVDGAPGAGRIAIGTTLRRGWRPPAAHALFLALLEEVAASLGGVGRRPSLVEKRWV
jgi:DNA-binding transcriptional LysR family regulator